MGNRVNIWIVKKFKKLRALFGDKCVYCGSTENLQFAHIKKTKLSGTDGRGRKERYYDIRNNPKSYVLACKKCHEDLDRNSNLSP